MVRHQEKRNRLNAASEFISFELDRKGAMAMAVRMTVNDMMDRYCHGFK